MSNEYQNSNLSKEFKIKMGLLAIGVIISLLAVLAFVSTQGCPAYFLNFPMRTVDCDLSNTLTMALELTVAGTFAIILGLIFYQKQKKITGLAKLKGGKIFGFFCFHSWDDQNFSVKIKNLFCIS